jgi:prepilin-type N-terminal cleavage/methylation domain-containing protein
MKERGCRSSNGFTLIELMIVVVIIMIMLGLSTALLAVFRRGQAVKRAANIVSLAFRQAQIRATATRQIHFLVFKTDPNSDNFVRLVRDLDADKEFDGTADHPDDEAIEGGISFLPPQAVFDLNSDCSPLMRRDPAWLGFNPDSSLLLAGGASDDLLFRPPPSGHTADIIIRQRGGRYRTYLDFVQTRGKIRAWVFATE